jgi:hypothetical protein
MKPFYANFTKFDSLTESLATKPQLTIFQLTKSQLGVKMTKFQPKIKSKI